MDLAWRGQCSWKGFPYPAHDEDFDAHEQIRFEQTDPQGMIEKSMAAEFDYLVDFGEKSGHKLDETRTLMTATLHASSIGSKVLTPGRPRRTWWTMNWVIEVSFRDPRGTRRI